MKHGLSLAASIALCLLASACAAVPDEPPPPPPRVLAADYSSTYFEYRNAMKDLLMPPIARAILGTNNYDRRGDRLAANAYEQRLGDFDTSDYFFSQLEPRFADIHRFHLTATRDPVQQQQVIQFLQPDNDTPATIQLPLPGGGTANAVAAFRVMYGIGMKEGAEQIGFRKTYRIFIRLNGMIRDAHTGDEIWSQTVMVFGDKGYGLRAAGEVSGPEMVATYKELTAKAIDLTLRSLNGEQLPTMPSLAGANLDDRGF